MRLFLVILSVMLFSCKENKQVSQELDSESTAEEISSMDLEVLDFEGLRPLLETDEETIHVVNFWATWCAPCINELPDFEKLNANYKDENVKVLLVSLDFPKKYDSHLKPYIKKNNLKSRVVALNDANSNSWIPEVDPSWSGAIPATLIFNKNKRTFYEKPFTYEELETEIKIFIDN